MQKKLNVLLLLCCSYKFFECTHTKKRGTFSVFLSQGVWRDLTNRITKSPRLYSVSIFAIFLLVHL